MTTTSQRVQAKAARYLLEGHVRVDYADQRSFIGLVDGTRKVPYLVMWAGGWRCDCPASIPGCSHVVACQAVWTPPAAPEPSPWAGEDPFALLGDDLGEGD